MTSIEEKSLTAHPRLQPHTCAAEGTGVAFDQGQVEGTSKPDWLEQEKQIRQRIEDAQSEMEAMIADDCKPGGLLDQMIAREGASKASAVGEAAQIVANTLRWLHDDARNEAQAATAICNLIDAKIKEATPGILRAAGVVVKP